MNTYKVVYRFEGELRHLYLPMNRGLGDVRDGFWVDTDFEYSQISTSKYWIPPSKIEYVEKVIK